MQQISRGKFDRLQRTAARFTVTRLDGYGLCCSLPTRPLVMASYLVFVHRRTPLLRASFRPHLTATPLSAPFIRIQLAAVFLRSWKRKSEMFTDRQARKNASDTFSGVTGSRLKTRSVGLALPGGTAARTCCAIVFRFTTRPSPFFVCGSMIRPPLKSISSQRSPRTSPRVIPVATARPAIGRSHSGQAPKTARNSVGCK